MGQNFAKKEDDEGIVWRLRAGLTRIRGSSSAAFLRCEATKK